MTDLTEDRALLQERLLEIRRRIAQFGSEIMAAKLGELPAYATLVRAEVDLIRELRGLDLCQRYPHATEALLQTVALQQAAWINAESQLPPGDQPVLARFKPVEPLYDGQPPFEVCVAAYDAKKAKATSRLKSRPKAPPPVVNVPRCNWYRYAARGNACHYFAATHWQSLPALPKDNP